MFDATAENLQGPPAAARLTDTDERLSRGTSALSREHTPLDHETHESASAASDTLPDEEDPFEEGGGTPAPDGGRPIERVTAEMIASERDRLVRLCLRFTGGNSDLAEDLAQEAMVEAVRSLPTLRDPLAWRSWLAGIGRNVCLRWARRHSLEQSRIVRLPDLFGGDPDPSGPGGPAGNGASSASASPPIVLVAADDLEGALEQEEIASLLDRAMSRIPDKMRRILVEHYVEDLPQAEIAARRGIREETVAVQMHRGRKALRDVLVSAELRQQAAELGLIADASAPWQETHIWCPMCGRRRMIGKFNAGQDRTTEVNEFVLRCPECNAGPDAAPFTVMRLDDGARFSEVLRGIKGFKPALNRISNLWLHYVRGALARGSAPCLLCDKPVPVEFRIPTDIAGSEGPPQPAFFLRCRHCETLCYADVTMLGLWQPEAQAFWRGHPRIRVLPGREISAQGGTAAVLTRIESVTTSEVLDIVTARDTLQVMDIVAGSR